MQNKIIWWFVSILGITSSLQFIGINIDASPFMYSREEFLSSIYWQWITPSLVHQNWIHWFLNISNLLAVLVILNHVWTVKKVSLIFASSSLFTILCIHFYSENFSYYLGMSGILYTLVVYGAIKSINRNPYISIFLLLYVLLKLVAHDWVNHIMGVDIILNDLIVLTDVHWYGAMFGLIYLFVEFILTETFKASPNSMQEKPSKKVNHFLNPLAEEYIDTLLYWRKTYGLNVPKEHNALQNISELVVDNNDMPRLPKAVIHLVNLKKVVLTNTPNIILSVRQKRWIQKLKKQGCEVVLDDGLIEKCVVVQSQEVVICKAYVSERLETRYDFKYKILLKEVFVYGKFFRNHTFVKSSKHWVDVKVGDFVTFSAKVSIYFHRGKRKKGLRHIRNIQRTNVPKAYDK